jgi:spore germination cell wall hydrolase CwlJ-like protein
MTDPLTCLFIAIYFEARGEPELGQAAVAHVILNRVASERYPDDICSVVKQTHRPGTKLCQFSFWCDGKSDVPRDSMAYMQVMLVGLAVLDGDIPDPTDGATHYHATSVRPAWGKELERGPLIGQHQFYKEM